MALLTDGPIATLEDLRAIDSAIVEIAKNEGINLTHKLETAQSAIQLELAVFLLRMAGSPPASTANAYDLGHVAVTPALARWHTLRTLAEFYGDAYNSQLNDRYLGRWRHYLQQAKEAADMYFELGVGIVRTPVPRAAMPALRLIGGGGEAMTTLVRVAWRNAMGEAGAASEVAVADGTEGQTIEVTPGPPPAGAASFDVFAGRRGERVTRQNALPIPAGSLWLVPAGELPVGAAPGPGQAPDYYVRRRRLI